MLDKSMLNDYVNKGLKIKNLKRINNIKKEKSYYDLKNMINFFFFAIGLGALHLTILIYCKMTDHGISFLLYTAPFCFILSMMIFYKIDKNIAKDLKSKNKNSFFILIFLGIVFSNPFTNTMMLILLFMYLFDSFLDFLYDCFYDKEIKKWDVKKAEKKIIKLESEKSNIFEKIIKDEDFIYYVLFEREKTTLSQDIILFLKENEKSIQFENHINNKEQNLMFNN